MSSILIAPDDPARADITALLEVHAAFALEESPPDTCHFLDVAGLKTPDITFWSARDGETLLGVVALKALDDRSGEVKSMHVAAAHRGKGMAGVILNHLIEQARLKAMTRLSLETGSQDGFAPARALYARHGFAFCEPFADYRLDPSSVFMTREI
ncbi:MAG TPA: GNAT family N-acetyltransferase [Rhodospirillaceae bacterium]|nr:GNAT family N-acetyltransferase [Rhodospirillaceae bacterium]